MQGCWNINRAGGRSLDKGTCTDYDVIMMSEFSLRGSGGFRDGRAQGLNHLWGP